MKLSHEGWECWGRGAGVTAVAGGRTQATCAWQVWGKQRLCCLEYSGKVGVGILGDAKGSRTHSRGMLASVLLFLKPNGRNCCLSCSLSCMPTSSETLSDSNNRCHLWSSLCTRIQKQRLREPSHTFATLESSKVAELTPDSQA